MDLPFSGAARVTPSIAPGLVGVSTEFGAIIPPAALDEAFSVNGTPATWDVGARTVQVEIRREGETASAPLVGSGQVRFTAVDALDRPIGIASNKFVAVAASAVFTTSEMSSSAIIAPGRYLVELISRDPGLGFGISNLGIMTIGTTDQNLVFTVPSIDLTLELRAAGQPLPSSTGANRGAVSVAGQVVTIPATGPALATFRLVPGRTSASYSCVPSNGCAQDTLPSSVILFSDLQLE